MRIELASLLKRCTAAFIDVSIVIFFMLSLFSLAIVPIINGPIGGDDIVIPFRQIQFDSYLFIPDEARGIKPVSEQQYPEAIYRYYVESEVAFTSYDKEEYYDEILKRNSEDNLFNFEGFIDEGEPWNVPFIDDNAQQVANLYELAYQTAINDLQSNPDYILLEKQLSRFLTIGFIIAFFTATIIYYVAIPLLTKHGQTFGKMLLGICLVNKLGYRVTKIQILYRGMCVIIFNLAGALIGLAFISFLMMGYSKKRISLPDFIAATQVIEKGRSLWFKNANEEDEYQEEMPTILPQAKADEEIEK
jgi:uncharacterized RDD family membrane protein YckC